MKAIFSDHILKSEGQNSYFVMKSLSLSNIPLQSQQIQLRHTTANDSRSGYDQALKIIKSKYWEDRTLSQTTLCIEYGLWKKYTKDVWSLLTLLSPTFERPISP